MIKLDDDILSKFSRPRDGLILVYLKAKAVDDVITTTYQQIAKDTDYSLKQIRSSLSVLESQGQTKGRPRAGCQWGRETQGGLLQQSYSLPQTIPKGNDKGFLRLLE